MRRWKPGRWGLRRTRAGNVEMARAIPKTGPEHQFQPRMKSLVSVRVVFIYLFIHSFIHSWDWSLNSGSPAYEAGALLLGSHLQSILLWLFWQWDLANYLPGLASNYNPPDLSSSKQLGLQGWATGAGALGLFKRARMMAPSLKDSVSLLIYSGVMHWQSHILELYVSK
jgi:hypothetical protein